jgi:hypothetical protein
MKCFRQNPVFFVSHFMCHFMCQELRQEAKKQENQGAKRKRPVNHEFTSLLSAQDWISSADPGYSYGGRTQSLCTAFGGARRFDLLTPASELASFTNQNASPTSLERRLCPGLDSNQHTLRRCYLKAVRLPISPPGHSPAGVAAYAARYFLRGANIGKDLLPTPTPIVFLGGVPSSAHHPGGH